MHVCVCVLSFICTSFGSPGTLWRGVSSFRRAARAGRLCAAGGQTLAGTAAWRRVNSRRLSHPHTHSRYEPEACEDSKTNSLHHASIRTSMLDFSEGTNTSSRLQTQNKPSGREKMGYRNKLLFCLLLNVIVIEYEY